MRMPMRTPQRSSESPWPCELSCVVCISAGIVFQSSSPKDSLMKARQVEGELVPITAPYCPPTTTSRRSYLGDWISPHVPSCVPPLPTSVATSAWFGHLVAGRCGRVARQTRLRGGGGLGLRRVVGRVRGRLRRLVRVTTGWLPTGPWLHKRRCGRRRCAVRDRRCRGRAAGECGRLRSASIIFGLDVPCALHDELLCKGHLLGRALDHHIALARRVDRLLLGDAHLMRGAISGAVTEATKRQLDGRSSEAIR